MKSLFLHKNFAILESIMNKKFEIKKKDQFNKFVNSFLGNLFFCYCLIVAFALIIFSVVTLECEVLGTSMQPNLNEKGANKSDTVYVNRYNHDYEYGDIVVISTDNDPIIKRVLGLPNDLMDIVKDENNIYKLERNGEIISEEYILVNSGVSVPTYSQNGMDKAYERFQYLKNTNPELFNSEGKLIVGIDEIFVLGDNRAVSVDSATQGCFKMSKVQGIVEFIKYYGDSDFNFYWDYIIDGKFFYTIFNAI